MYVPERLNINLSTVPFVQKEVHVLIDVWSSACLCVSWSGGGVSTSGDLSVAACYGATLKQPTSWS